MFQITTEWSQKSLKKDKFLRNYQFLNVCTQFSQKRKSAYKLLDDPELQR